MSNDAGYAFAMDHADDFSTDPVITEAELARALNAMILSPESGVPIPAPEAGANERQGWLVHDGKLIAAGAFKVARSQRAESARWITGELYLAGGPGVTEGGTPVKSVYLREEHGWFAWSCHAHFRDGQVDTSGFRRLIPEEPQP